MNKDLQLSRIQTLERQHKAEQEKLFAILKRRNALSAKPETDEVLLSKVQGCTTSAELAALVDVLCEMGKIDKVDFVKHCVDRLKQLVQII